MTDSRPSLYPELTRPARDAQPGPLDDALYDVVESRFERLLRDNPILATALGLHEHDDKLGDGSVDALLGELEAERAHLSFVESLDPEALSPTARFERELEIHNVRAATFDTEAVRTWERRSLALDTIGDGLFLLFARDHAPLPDRLEAIAGRLEAIPTFLDQARSRARVPQVRLWQGIEIETAEHLPTFLDEIAVAAEGIVAETAARRLNRAIQQAKIAVAEYRGSLHDSIEGGTDDWALGRELHDELVARRAFDGLDSDAILALGWEKLEEEKAARAATASEIDPDVDEAAVIDRVKSDHPATFPAALDAYRDSMLRARRHLLEHDLISIPDDERIEVIETPTYLRNVLPFAAYFEPAKFDPNPKGIYVVTPAVGENPSAMREHNFAGISNTSIHEAYPGHHLQLSVAAKQRSLTRVLTDAPEFVEGWGMYSELLMREHGFDDDARFRLILHTDAIWRACRIILDVRMHRGELSIDEATDFLVEQTAFETPNARAEVQWYSYRPTYPMSYLLGRTLLLGLRADEQRRLGDGFRLKAFHDTLLRNGSLPISFHRRLLAAGPAPRPADSVQVIPSVDLQAGRSRVVYWPGAAAGIGAPTDRPERIAERFVAMGAPVIHLVDFDGARAGTPANLEVVGAVASKVAVPLQLAGGVDGPDQIRLAFAAGATRVVLAMGIVDRPDDLRTCLAVAGDWLAVGLDPRPDRFAAFPWSRPGPPPTLETLIGELVGHGVARFVLTHGGSEPDLSGTGRLVRSYDADFLVAGGVSDLDGLRRLRDTGIAGVILGEALLSGAIDYQAAMEAAA